MLDLRTPPGSEFREVLMLGVHIAMGIGEIEN